MSRVPQILRRDMDRNRTSTTPINIHRSTRNHEVTAITSMPAGRIVPLSVIPILREDEVHRGQMTLSFEMHETAQMLLNGVHVLAQAWFVPFLAFERFKGMDDLNRSYMSEPREPGEDPISFFETEARGTVDSNEVLKYLGLHAKETDQINTAYNEAYNLIVNQRLTQRSLDLTKRERLDKTLAPAFWRHDRFRHIVGDYDQARMEGEVALRVAEARMPVTGIGAGDGTYTGGSNVNVREAGGDGTEQYSSAKAFWDGAGQNNIYLEQDPNNPGYPNIFANLPSDSIKVLLSDIETAKTAAWFAGLREQFAGHSDDYIIDLLMQGIQVPEQLWQQPLNLASRHTMFGFSKRYATDGSNLTQSVVNGATAIDLSFTLPRITTGGVIMITAEFVPDQIFERTRDPLLFASSVDDLPALDRDFPDPEKVREITNGEIDTDHSDPDGLFGYGPENSQWFVTSRRAGGRYFRPSVNDPTDEDRMQIWSVEHTDPSFNEDHHLATNIHTEVFEDTEEDPVEVVASGLVVIGGNTMFGPALSEANNNYEKVEEKIDMDRIDKD